MRLPAVLIYNADKEDMLRFQMFSAKNKVFVHNISKNEFGEKISAILGMTETTQLKGNEYPSESIILFAGFSENLLDTYLSAMRRGEIPQISLKAVVTKVNAEWTLEELYKALCLEREVFRKSK